MRIAMVAFMERTRGDSNSTLGAGAASRGGSLSIAGIGLELLGYANVAAMLHRVAMATHDGGAASAASDVSNAPHLRTRPNGTTGEPFGAVSAAAVQRRGAA